MDLLSKDEARKTSCHLIGQLWQITTLMCRTGYLNRWLLWYLFHSLSGLLIHAKKAKCELKFMAGYESCSIGNGWMTEPVRALLLCVHMALGIPYLIMSVSVCLMQQEFIYPGPPKFDMKPVECCLGIASLCQWVPINKGMALPSSF